MLVAPDPLNYNQTWTFQELCWHRKQMFTCQSKWNKKWEHQQQEESKYRECTKSKPVKKSLFWLIFLLGWTIPLTVKAKDIKIMRWYLISEVKDLLNIFFVVLDCGTSLWRAHQTQQKKLIWFCLHQENHIYGRHIQKPPFFVSRLLFSCIHSWGICSPGVHQQYNIWILRLQK